MKRVAYDKQFKLSSAKMAQKAEQVFALQKEWVDFCTEISINSP